MKLRSIQFLRAIAVLLVIYMHSLDFQPAAAQQHFFFLPPFGAIGVDIFFVISGFIITWSASRYLGRREGWKFLTNRFLRLVPIYWLATLLLITIWLGKGVSLHEILKSNAAGLPSLPLLSKTLFLLPLADDHYFINPLLSVAWTLSFEWLFYFLFFAAIILSVRYKALFLTILIIGLVVTGNLLHPGGVRMLFLTNPMILEFVLGIALHTIVQKGKIPVAVAWFLLLAGICLYGYEVVTGFGEIWKMENIVDGRLSFTRFLQWGLPSASLVAGCLFLETNGSLTRIWSNRVITLIGDASYSIYLTHLSVYVLCYGAFKKMNPDLAVFLQCGVAVIGGILFYKIAEAPLLNKMKRSQKKIVPA